MDKRFSSDADIGQLLCTNVVMDQSNLMLINWILFRHDLTDVSGQETFVVKVYTIFNL